MKKIILLLVISSASLFASAQSWTKISSFFADRVNRCVSFSIPSLGKGYVIAGYSDVYDTNAWEYDTLTNTWASIAPFPGAASAQVAFSIGNYGYVGTGTGANYTYDSTFWKYDPFKNTWTKLHHFPGAPRAFAVGFAVGGYGYIGCGCNGLPGTAHQFKDFWRYDTTSKSWDSITHYPGAGFVGDVGFVMGNNGYVGTGSSIDSNFNQTTQQDFYQYTPTSNTWTAKANFGGGPRGEGMAFGTCSKGYEGCGYSDGLQTNLENDFWQYDQSSNTWSAIANYGGGDRAYGTAFCIGKSGYVGFGRETSSTPNVGDVWKFNTPDALPLLVDTPSNQSICQYTNAILKVTGSGSNYIWSPSIWLNATTGSSVIATPSPGTIYYTVVGINSNGCLASATDTVNVSPAPNRPSITDTIIGLDTILRSTAASYNQWYKNNTPIMYADSQTHVVKGRGWYKVRVFDPANGCSTISDSIYVFIWNNSPDINIRWTQLHSISPQCSRSLDEINFDLFIESKKNNTTLIFADT